MERLVIKNLNKSFGSLLVLEDISISYQEGKIYGLIGENGAGKTTLFNCILGINEFEGKIEKMNEMQIGYLPSSLYFYPLITGQEYIEFCIKAKDMEIDSNAIEQWNKVFRLPLDRYATEYSTGMKKKLAFMALLLQKNDIYILDEPFNGVDLTGCILMKKMIRSLKHENKTVIISSHQIVALHEICDSIHYLYNHKIANEFVTETVDEIERQIINENMNSLNLYNT